MRVALDTNILAYAEGLGDAARCAAARQLIKKLPSDQTLLPAQSYLMSLPDFDTQRFIGAADVIPDNDGTLRSIYPNPPLQLKADDTRLLSLPFLLAVHASGQSPAADQWQFGGRTILAGAPTSR